MIPSFFKTLESPAVGEYKHQQELALKSVVAGKKNDDVAPQANEPNPAEPIGRRASALLGTNMSFHEDCRFDEDSSYNDIDEDEDQDESRDDFAREHFLVPSNLLLLRYLDLQSRARKRTVEC